MLLCLLAIIVMTGYCTLQNPAFASHNNPPAPERSYKPVSDVPACVEGRFVNRVKLKAPPGS